MSAARAAFTAFGFFVSFSKCLVVEDSSRITAGMSWYTVASAAALEPRGLEASVLASSSTCRDGEPSSIEQCQHETESVTIASIEAGVTNTPGA